MAVPMVKTMGPKLVPKSPVRWDRLRLGRIALRSEGPELEARRKTSASLLLVAIQEPLYSSFLLLVVRPGAPSSVLLLVVRPGAPSSVLVPSSDALRSCARVEDEDGAIHRLRGQVTFEGLVDRHSVHVGVIDKPNDPQPDAAGF